MQEQYTIQKKGGKKTGGDESFEEVEDVKKYLTPSIVENLESEAMSLNFLERKNSLDI